MAVKPKKTSAKKAAPKKKASAPQKPSVKALAKKAAPKKTKAAPKKAATKKTAVKKAVPKAPVKKKSAAKKAPKAPRGIPEILRDSALKVLDDRQAENIAIINLQGKSAIADYAIIASGRSGRQLAAIADYLREAFFKAGVKQIRIEGLEQADWVLVDAGDVLVHLFRPEVREYYQIEDIWSGSPRKR